MNKRKFSVPMCVHVYRIWPQKLRFFFAWPFQSETAHMCDPISGQSKSWKYYCAVLFKIEFIVLFDHLSPARAPDPLTMYPLLSDSCLATLSKCFLIRNTNIMEWYQYTDNSFTFKHYTFKLYTGNHYCFLGRKIWTKSLWPTSINVWLIGWYKPIKLIRDWSSYTTLQWSLVHHQISIKIGCPIKL